MLWQHAIGVRSDLASPPTDGLTVQLCVPSFALPWVCGTLAHKALCIVYADIVPDVTGVPPRRKVAQIPGYCGGSGGDRGFLFAGDLSTPVRFPIEQAARGEASARAAGQRLRERSGNRLRDRLELAALSRPRPQTHGGRSECRNEPAGAKADQAGGHRG